MRRTWKIGRLYITRFGHKIYFADGKHALRYFNLKRFKMIVYKDIKGEWKNDSTTK